MEEDQQRVHFPYGYCYCGCGEKTVINTRTDSTKNWVKGEPRKYVWGHQRRPPKPKYVIEDRGYVTPCWVWQWYVGRAGYGTEHINGKSVFAHRLYYELCRGPIPEDLQLDHLCRVTECMNPWHLEAVTPLVNARRSNKPRLGIEAVCGIWRLRESGERVCAIAETFHVAPGTVQAVLDGRTWKDVSADYHAARRKRSA